MNMRVGVSAVGFCSSGFSMSTVCDETKCSRP